MRRRTYLNSVASGIGIGIAGCLGLDDTSDRTPSTPTDENGTTGPTVTAGSQTVVAETVVEGLEVPWGAAYRDETLYVTERPGRVVRVSERGIETVADFTESTQTGGEGGLLGLVFHPENTDTAFTYQTYDADDGRRNRIVRHDVADGWSREVVLDGIPGSSIHDGGRLVVHDDALFVTTGDASESNDAQDPQLLNGKILRLTLDGRPHPDNPFDNAVFTYGHRNPEGLAARDGTLYAIEHGPDSDDEINRLESGGNYGWPDVTGPSNAEEFTDPVVTYEEIIAPGGGVFYDGPIERWQGDLFIGTLVKTHLRRVRLRNGTATEDQTLYEGDFGRLRTTFIGPDRHLYVTTSNRDGRGSPTTRDDRILRLRPT